MMQRLILAAALAVSVAVPAMAQPTTLRIGLREDPDMLDPTLGSSYVGRIVYAAMCWKSCRNWPPAIATSTRRIC